MNLTFATPHQELKNLVYDTLLASVGPIEGKGWQFSFFRMACNVLRCWLGRIQCFGYAGLCIKYIQAYLTPPTKVMSAAA